MTLTVNACESWPVKTILCNTFKDWIPYGTKLHLRKNDLASVDFSLHFCFPGVLHLHTYYIKWNVAIEKKTAPFLASITQKMYAPSQSSASWHHWDLKRQIRHTFLAACCKRDTIHNKMGLWQLGCILQSKSTRGRQLEPESPVLKMLRFLFVKWMQPIPLNKFSENVSPLLTKM